MQGPRPGLWWKLRRQWQRQRLISTLHGRVYDCARKTSALSCLSAPLEAAYALLLLERMHLPAPAPL
eukprot:1160401-Pelagomonas_calceolata.AAC.1